MAARYCRVAVAEEAGAILELKGSTNAGAACCLRDDFGWTMTGHFERSTCIAGLNRGKDGVATRIERQDVTYVSG